MDKKKALSLGSASSFLKVKESRIREQHFIQSIFTGYENKNLAILFSYRAAWAGSVAIFVFTVPLIGRLDVYAVRDLHLHLEGRIIVNLHFWPDLTYFLRFFLQVLGPWAEPCAEPCGLIPLSVLWFPSTFHSHSFLASCVNNTFAR